MRLESGHYKKGKDLRLFSKLLIFIVQMFLVETYTYRGKDMTNSAAKEKRDQMLTEGYCVIPDILPEEFINE